MAKCYICDKGLDEVRVDHRDLKPRPCRECEEIIFEAAYESLQEEDDNVPEEIELDDYDANDCGPIDLGDPER